MRTLAEKPKTSHTVSAKSAFSIRPRSTRTADAGAADHSRRTETVRFGYDVGRIPVHPTDAATPVQFNDKSVDGISDSQSGLVEDKDPGTGAPKDAGPPAGAPKKTAGVDSFVVKWKENPISGEKTAKLRLDYAIKFTKDANHDPALAEFRQNAFHTFKVTAGPHKGQEDNNPPLHDDHYSRADDTAGNAIDDVNFVSNDNPGAVKDSLDKDDVIDYSFTAEQMVIDTSDGNKVVAKRGPHTATITGKHPRDFDKVPKTLN